MKVLDAIKSVCVIIGLLAAGIATGALFAKRTRTKTVETDAEKAREDTYAEIENTPAGQLVADASNADGLGTIKDGIKADFRERIRDRLQAELHRLGNLGADSDSGAGSASGD